VCRQKERDSPLASDLVQESENLVPVAAVQVAGGLVGQQQASAGDQSPRDGDALHLSPRELIGMRGCTRPKAHALEQLLRPPGRVGFSIQRAGQLDVLEHVDVSEEVEELKHHPDLAAAVESALTLIERAEVSPAHLD
jgi:hypothetical protein